MFRSIMIFIGFSLLASVAMAQTGGGPRDNNNDDDVQEVQELLYRLNYDVGPRNGVMRRATRQAIRKVQRRLRMDVTGEVSRRLLRRLRKAKKPTVWGAIAMTTSGDYGSAWNYKTREGAERRARKGCRKHASRKRCGTPLTLTGSQCAVLVTYKTRKHRGYVTRSRPSMRRARSTAMNACRDNPKSRGTCKVRTSFCADGSHK